VGKKEEGETAEGVFRERGTVGVALRGFAGPSRSDQEATEHKRRLGTSPRTSMEANKNPGLRKHKPAAQREDPPLRIKLCYNLEIT